MGHKTAFIKMLLLGICATSFSGCRFGNHADTASQNSKIHLLKSELFFTEAKTFQTFIFYDDNTHSVNQNSPLVAIPSDILDLFSNPVYWQTLDDPGQTQYFWDSRQKNYPWITLADSTGKIKTADTSAPGKFYRNPNCVSQIQTLQDGKLDRTVPGTSVLPGDNKPSKVSGHLVLDITRVEALSGDCVDDLKELANCFKDGTGCDANQLSRAKLFNLFVNGTGVLNIQDAARIIGLAYIVHFE